MKYIESQISFRVVIKLHSPALKKQFKTMRKYLSGFSMLLLITSCTIEDIGVGTKSADEMDINETVSFADKVKEVTIIEGGNSLLYEYKYDSLNGKVAEVSISKAGGQEVVKPVYNDTGTISSYEINGQTYAKLVIENNTITQVSTPTYSESFSYNTTTNQLSTYRYNSQVERKIYEFKWVGKSLFQVILKGTVNNDESTIQEGVQLNPLKDFFIENLGIIPFDYTLINPFLVANEALLFKGLAFTYNYEFTGKKLINIKKRQLQIDNSSQLLREVKISYY